MATDIPGLGKAVFGAQGKPLERMREELQILLGTRGDPMDAALTLRSAIERGLIDRIGNALVGNVTYVNTFPTTGSGGGASTTPDMTAPPTVAGLVVTAGFSSVLVQFTAPSYTTRSGTASNQRTNIYAVKKDPSDATLPTFSAGVTPLVSAAAGTLNIVSIPSELNTRWHVWAKHLTVDGVESTVAAGGTSGYNLAGAYPTTGQDTAQLLGVLAGQITTSELAVALNTRINLVDAASGVAGSVNARVLSETTARDALTLQLRGTNTGTDVSDLSEGLIYSERQARITAVGTQATRVDGLVASVNTPGNGLLSRASALETTTTAAGSGNAALAQRALTLEASVNSPTDANNPTRAALSVEASVRASQTGPILASYSVKLDVNGYMSGYGLTSSLVAGGTPTSMFLVSVDKFAVATPASSITNWSGGQAIGVNEIRGVAGNTDKVLVCKTPGTTSGATPAIAGAIGTTLQDGGVSWQIASRVPFAVLTVPTTINGVAVPAGVYIDAAYVLNGTIKKSQLGDAIIDNAKVVDMSAAKLLTGALAVGADISSTGFVAGSTGWRIQGDGNAEFSGVIVRGTLYATAGLIGGAVIGASYVQSTNYVANTSGWRLDNTSGELLAYAGTFAGTLKVGSSPAVSGSTMTGTGAVFNAGGTFAAGTSTKNISFNGSTLTLNGELVVTGNLEANAATILSRGYSNTAVACPATTNTSVMTVPWTSTGAPVLFIVSTTIEWLSPTAANCQFSVVTNTGATIWSGYFQSTRLGMNTATFVITWDTPPAGAVSLTLKAYPSLAVDVYNTTLVALEAKK